MALIMERERKKRRFNLNDSNTNTNTNTDTDNDTDDVKMDKFFALIRSAKDIRDQLLGIEAPRLRGKQVVEAIPTSKEDELKTAVWLPAFQPEDFGGHGVIIKTDVAGSSKRSTEDSPNKAADHSNSNNNHVKGRCILLDLNLSL